MRSLIRRCLAAGTAAKTMQIPKTSHAKKTVTVVASAARLKPMRIVTPATNQAVSSPCVPDEHPRNAQEEH